jgi:hypothetical protein
MYRAEQSPAPTDRKISDDVRAGFYSALTLVCNEENYSYTLIQYL